MLLVEAALELAVWELVCVAFELVVAELERVVVCGVVVWAVVDELALAAFTVDVDFDD